MPIKYIYAYAIDAPDVHVKWGRGVPSSTLAGQHVFSPWRFMVIAEEFN